MVKSKVSASQKYWEKRRALEDQYRLIQENATLKKLTDDILPDALKEIQKQLTAQADLHNITMDELLADYSTRDQKKYREHVEKNYKELMDSDEKYQEFIDEYFPNYDYAKVNRLLQIRTDIFDTFAREMIKKDANKVFNDRLEDIVQRTYSSNSQALARIINVNVPNKLSQSELDNILNYPWSGKTFSNRLWGNVSKLEQNLSAAIVKSISSGQGVMEALKTMRQDPEICDMFKQESSKYKRALENLVRTEYASFAQQGIAKSYEATGVEEYDVLTAEDEKVCTVCGGASRGNPYKLKDAVIGVNRGPFHGRCRCTDIPHITDLPDSIDKEYEAMFGDLLDEFAKDQFGVNLKTSDSLDLYTSLKSNFSKTKIKDVYGEDIFNSLLVSIDDIKDPKILKLFDKYISDVNFVKNKSEKSAYAIENTVYMHEKDFNPSNIGNKNEVFFHEVGHAIDNLILKKVTDETVFYTGKKVKYKIGGRTIEKDEFINTFSGFGKENLPKILKEDLKNYVLGDMISEKDYKRSLGKKPTDHAEFMDWSYKQLDYSQQIRKKWDKFESDMFELKNNNPRIIANLSDIVEATGMLGKAPFGFGHGGNKYWKIKGNTETEFFAEVTSALSANEESFKLLKEIFPKGIEKYYNILKEALKEE